MKKYLLAAFLLIAMVALGACSSNDDTTTPGTGTGSGTTGQGGATNQPPATQPVTLVVGESLGATEDFIREAGRRFTQLHPHITIDFLNVEVGGAHTQIALDGPAGIGPDVFAAPHDQLGSLVAGGHVLPTRNPNQVAAQVLGSGVIATTFNGIMYGYPISSETYALFYNRALIASADVPRTFEDLITFGQEFNANNPGMFAFMFEVGNAYYTIIFTTSDGNRLFGPYGVDRNNSNINSPASAQGMEFFRSLRTILDVPSGDLNTAFADAAFEAGQVAMIVTGPWKIVDFENAGIDFGITTLPSLPGQTSPPASFSGTRVMFVSAYTHHANEAHMFAEFLISGEMQALRTEMTGAIPAIPVAIDNHISLDF